MARRSPQPALTTPLTDRARADLARSGLGPEDAVAMRLSALRSPVGPLDNYRIPYLDIAGQDTGFYRDKIFDSDTVKYLQPAGTAPQVYFAPGVPWLRTLNSHKTPLLITEGEKKAACACKHKFACVGLGGVDAWRRRGEPLPALEAIPMSGGRQVYVVFDTDATLNPRVQRAQSALATYLSARGAAVFLVSLPAPAGEKVGLDDFLVAHGSAALQAVLDAAEPFDDYIAALNEEYFAVRFGDSVAIGYYAPDPISGDPILHLSTVQHMRLWLANRLRYDPEKKKNVCVLDGWLASPYRRQYSGIVFSPSRDIEPSGEYLNLWQGFAVEPAAGDCALFLQHVWENICERRKDLYDYVIAWMAHAVQFPAQLPGTSLVLRGGMGVGKGVFATEFGALFGPHFRVVTSARQFLGNFNSHLADSIVVFADEAFWAGDKAHEGALKSLVTSDSRLLEKKGKDIISIRSYTRLIMAGNEDWLAPAGMRERRFLVLDVGDKHQQDTAYFDAILQQQRNGGREALLHYLLQVPLRGFDLRNLPHTYATQETQLHSLPLVGEFFFNMLAEGTNTCGERKWLPEVLASDIMRRFLVEHPRAPTHGLSTRLGTGIRQYIRGITSRLVRDGSNPDLSPVRTYVFPPLKVARAAFCRVLGSEIDWANPWGTVRRTDSDPSKEHAPPPAAFVRRRGRRR